MCLACFSLLSQARQSRTQTTPCPTPDGSAGQLEVGKLGLEGAREVVTGCVKGMLPAPVVDFILTHSDGVPL